MKIRLSVFSRNELLNTLHNNQQNGNSQVLAQSSNEEVAIRPVKFLFVSVRGTVRHLTNSIRVIEIPHPSNFTYLHAAFVSRLRGVGRFDKCRLLFSTRVPFLILLRPLSLRSSSHGQHPEYGSALPCLIVIPNRRASSRRREGICISFTFFRMCFRASNVYRNCSRAFTSGFRYPAVESALDYCQRFCEWRNTMLRCLLHFLRTELGKNCWRFPAMHRRLFFFLEKIILLYHNRITN